ncbi:MAG: biopolymer transporter ExbD [Candidatus Latescibacteria bacterium]|nr:biopolymer transporter ExbD [Candidatus Latescibacterota bacterium]MCK5526216.1 biopolymer transporter ExbD [Candidatus Latescibacterota bacterium]
MPAVSRSKKHRAKSSSGETLNLTSMMDMFTIILVFLLKSYSATGKMITIPEGYTLPESIAEELPVLAVNISVDNEYIMVDDALRIRVDQCRTGYGPPYIIDPLKQILLEKAAKQKLVVEKLGQSFEGEVNIMGDKDIDLDLLIKVMGTCGQSRFGKIKLLVSQSQSQ